MKKINSFTLGLLALLPATTATAAGIGALKENSGDDSLVSLLSHVRNWLIGIVGALTILFLIYGGFLYITSGGNKERTETAKKTITYAILGLVIVVLAGVILGLLTGNILPNFFGDTYL